MTRTLYVCLGWIALGLGLIGVFLPILPTTPFVLLAAYFFSKGSERLHQWLLQTRFGPLIQQWQQHGVIRRRPKWIASIVMSGLFAYTVIFVPVDAWIKASVVAIGVAVLGFIWTRPSSPPDPPYPLKH